MRKLTAIFFLFLSLISYTEFCELFKLPAIISHYSEHRKWDPSVDFLSYVQMHYLTDDNNAGDDEKDMQLPFKKHDDCCQAIHAPSIAVTQTEYNLSIDYNPCAIVYPLLNDEAAMASFSGNVFQPPRA